MSRNTLAALALLTLAAAAQASDAPAASDYALTANLTLASQYRYRGLMQTNNKPAIQGGFDLAHASGFYLGNWNSSISWLNDSNSDVSAPVEMDFYGGYKANLAQDVPLDVGVLQYYYPGKLGLTKDFGQGLSVSLAYLDTSADRAVYTNARGRDMGRATGLLSLTKAF